MQNTICWELSCGPVSLFLLECLSNSTFFYPLLKECHSCSANTEPWVCLRAYPSPSAHTIALLRLAHTLTACTVQTKKHGNIQCRCAGAREAICCTVWPSFLIGMLHVQSSDVQNKHGVRKASEQTQTVALVCKSWPSALPLPAGPHMHLPADTMNTLLTAPS